MFEYLFTGAGFAFAAAVQPGPLQAFLFSKVAQKGWKNTLPACFAPMLSDGPIALLILTILNRIPHIIIYYMQTAGGILLLYFAYSLYEQFKSKKENITATKNEPHTLFQAVTINLLNPNPYLGWSLVLGPMAIKAWHTAPFYSFILIGAFYITMTAALAGTIIVFGVTEFMNSKGQKRLIMLSGFVLALIGIFQIVTGLTAVIKNGT